MQELPHEFRALALSPTIHPCEHPRYLHSMKSKFAIHPTSDWKMTHTVLVTSGEQPSIGAGGRGGKRIENDA